MTDSRNTTDSASQIAPSGGGDKVDETLVTRSDGTGTAAVDSNPESVKRQRITLAGLGNEDVIGHFPIDSTGARALPVQDVDLITELRLIRKALEEVVFHLKIRGRI